MLRNRQREPDLRRIKTSMRPVLAIVCLPAPTTTLVMPLHIELTPSILEIVETALERLV